VIAPPARRGREDPIYLEPSAKATMPAAPPERATRPVRLPESLVLAIEERIRGSGFESVDAFVAFVLARLVERPVDGPFSEEDERVLKERLRSLGYID
jgi:hypothetical protein